jgi:hypothetical protein
MVYLHLKEGLDVEEVDWIGCNDPWATRRTKPGPETERKTSYAVLKDIQELLAGMRTDLDSFTEVEAWSLMTSGYLMAGDLVKKYLDWFPVANAAPGKWRFLALAPAMQGGPGYGELARQLGVSAYSAFKVWRLCSPLRVATYVLAAAGAAGLIWAGWNFWDWQFPLVRWVAGVLAGVVVTAIFGSLVKQLVWIRETVFRWIACLLLASFGWLVAAIHLGLFDRLFLRIGEARNITGSSTDEEPARS